MANALDFLAGHENAGAPPRGDAAKRASSTTTDAAAAAAIGLAAATQPQARDATAAAATAAAVAAVGMCQQGGCVDVVTAADVFIYTGDLGLALSGCHRCVCVQWQASTASTSELFCFF